MNFFKKIKSIIPTYQKHGLDGVLYALLKNLKINTKFVSIIDKKKYHIEKKIIKLTNGNVINGFYKSSKLTCKTHWGGFDNSSKLIGLYEEQVQFKAVDLQVKYGLEYIVNFGSGDGYHVIGLLKNKYYKEGLAFEINKLGQENIKENLLLNDLSDKVKIFDKADFNIVNKNLSRIQLKKTLFIVDIEGAEFELFDKANFEVFKESTLIIENHDFLANKKKVDIFFDLMNKNFNLEILNNGSRNPFEIPVIENFEEDEKWLMMSEGRKKNMNWLIFTPKNYEANT